MMSKLPYPRQRVTIRLLERLQHQVVLGDGVAKVHVLDPGESVSPHVKDDVAGLQAENAVVDGADQNNSHSTLHSTQHIVTAPTCRFR